AASAARSAAVTGSNPRPLLLSSMLSVVRKNGRIASPDTLASSSTKAAKSMAVMSWSGVRGQGEGKLALTTEDEDGGQPSRGWRRTPRQARRGIGRASFREGRPPLCFVRRGVYCCSAVTRPVAFPPPSLGVSSLDLGRLHPRAASFFGLFAQFCGGSPALSAAKPAVKSHAWDAMQLCEVLR